MSFKTWIESENGFPPNRGTATPGSDEVRRTGLQPQVGAEEIETHEKDEEDKVLAIDAKVKRFETEIPQGGEKVAAFRSLWDEFKDKWEKTKAGEQENTPEGGLASDGGDQDYVDQMRQRPNMMLVGGGLSPSNGGYS